MDIERKLRDKFIKYHQFYRMTADCNMKEIAQEMQIYRQKLYRWLKGKTCLNEKQLAYIKNLLDKAPIFATIISMLHSCLYYIFLIVGKSRLLGKFFNRTFDFLLNVFFVLSTTIKDIFCLKPTFQKVGFSF